MVLKSKGLKKILGRTLAIVQELNEPSQSLFKQAGPPCRPALAMYEDIDLLNSYIITVVEETLSDPLIAIPLIERCCL